MAKTLLDCEPLCGLPWNLSLASEPWEREDVFRLRYDVFNIEQGVGLASAEADGRDADGFDDWCDLLMLRDEARGELIGTYRLIAGPAAQRHGGFYSAAEFDLSPLEPIAPRVLEVGRTCVHPDYRNGLAMQFLWYGLELELQRRGLRYLLGAASFHTSDADELNRVYSYTKTRMADPDFVCNPVPRCTVANLREVPLQAGDEKLLPPLIRAYAKMGSAVCSPPAWDPDFRCHDLLILFRRDQPGDHCTQFLERMQRGIRALGRRAARPTTLVSA